MSISHRTPAADRVAHDRHRPPPQVSCLVRLEELDVSRNALAALPPALGRCSALRLLNAMANRLAAVPPQLGGLAALRRLGLKSNRRASAAVAAARRRRCTPATAPSGRPPARSDRCRPQAGARWSVR